MFRTIVIYGENDDFYTINKLEYYLNKYFDFVTIRNDTVDFIKTSHNRVVIMLLDTNDLSKINISDAVIICKNNFNLSMTKTMSNNIFVINSSITKEAILAKDNCGKLFAIGNKSKDILTYSSINEDTVTVAVMRGFFDMSDNIIDPLEMTFSTIQNEDINIYLLICFLLLYFNANIDTNKKIHLNSTNFQ